MEAIEQDDATYFANNPVFDSCSSVDIARLLPHLQLVRIKAGETLFQAGNKPGVMYLIKQGKLKLNSGQRLISEILPGGLAGQEAATGLDAYQAKAVAEEDVIAIALKAEMIQPLMAENKQLNSKIHRSFLNLFTEINNNIEKSITSSKEVELASTKITLGWFIAIILPLVVMHYGSEWGFDWNERVFIAVASATIVMWVFGVAPEFVPAIFAILSLVILGVVPKDVVLSGFTSSSFFMAIGIFSLGAVLLTSGLTYRIVLHLLHILPKTQSALGLGLLSIGFVLTPVIPSTNGRASLIAPIFVDMFNTLRYKASGKAATALAISAFTGLSLFAPIFLTSKSANFVVYGMLPEQVREQFSWMYWFTASIVAAVVLLVLFSLLVKFMFRNEESPILSRENIESQLKILGPIDLHEWAALIGIAFLAVGILTGSLHKISPAWIALIILYIFLTIGVFSKNQFRINIDWSFLFLLAGMIGIVKTMTYIGIDQRLSSNLSWLIPYMKDNFPLFVLLLSVSIVLVRFIIPNNPTIMIFAAIFVPVAENSGVNPWVVVFIILMMSDTWFMRYQSTYYVVFDEIANPDKQYEEKSFMKFNVLTIFIRLAAIYASLPFWSWLNII